MVDWIEEPGFGERARTQGKATEVPPEADAKLRETGRTYAEALQRQADEAKWQAEAEERIERFMRSCAIGAYTDDWWHNQKAIRAGLGLPDEDDQDAAHSSSPRWPACSSRWS